MTSEQQNETTPITQPLTTSVMNKSKLIAIGLLFLLLVIGGFYYLFPSEIAYAGLEYNVSGWDWSEEVI